MGFLDRLLGREPRMQGHADAPGSGGGSWTTQGSHGTAGPQQFGSAGAADQGGDDARAVARYRYLLRTAPPETLEQVHAEAFARLTPDQRHEVLTTLSHDAPQGETPASAQPQDLARAATRAEMRQPGTLERTFGGRGFGGAGVGMGGAMMGSMMGSVAGVVVGSAIAGALFNDYGSSPEAAEAGETGADVGSDGGPGGDAGGDPSGDTGGESGGTDWAGDTGAPDADASDFGGGDFGGGDFGGGDFGGF
ncbi:hypothetical protein [Knoellia sp. Soil729]|uniref:hypothetical protein n=1 Tax=Knoellia sp. Soil729 TaxID=1736394 RepID=UPI0006FB3C9F|nr:hypothetical protein [Knoellia sp. Soil729]KRE41013.1 hypothetical protein ASG74_14165 [Knoellia sp. Soil729]